jgi:hypothetical protein
VERVAARLIDELDERPPISLDVVASYRDIASVRIEPLPYAGSLTPETSGLVMRLNSGDPRERQRFSGFHEVGHTFQPGYLQQTLFRCNPKTANRPRRSSDPEQLSDVAAAELLLPRKYFVSDLADADPGWNGVTDLATSYESSLHATALRAVNLSRTPKILIILEPGVRKEDWGRHDAVPRLRVRSTAVRGEFHFIPQNKSVLDGGVLQRALAGESVEDTTTLQAEFGYPSEALRISARLFPYADKWGELHQRVMAIFWPIANHAVAS